VGRNALPDFADVLVTRRDSNLGSVSRMLLFIVRAFTTAMPGIATAARRTARQQQAQRGQKREQTPGRATMRHETPFRSRTKRAKNPGLLIQQIENESLALKKGSGRSALPPRGAVCRTAGGSLPCPDRHGTDWISCPRCRRRGSSRMRCAGRSKPLLLGDCRKCRNRPAECRSNWRRRGRLRFRSSAR